MSNTTSEVTVFNRKGQFEENSIADLFILSTHFRKDQGDLTKLKESIKGEGQLNLIIIFEDDNGKKFILDGGKRVNVLQHLAVTTVRCINYGKMPLEEATHLSFIINAEQTPPTPLEKAQHFRLMMERWAYTLEQMELKGYGSTSTISQHLKLLNLPESIQEHHKKGDLAFTHCIELAKLEKGSLIEAMAKKAINQKWSANQTAMKISQFLDKEKMTIIEPAQAPESEIDGVTFKAPSDTSTIKSETIQLAFINLPRKVGTDFNNAQPYHDFLGEIDSSLKEVSRVAASGGTVAIITNNIPDFKGDKGRNCYTQLEMLDSKCQPLARKHELLLKGQIVCGSNSPAHELVPQQETSEKLRHTEYKLKDNYSIISLYEKRGRRKFPSGFDHHKALLSPEELNEYSSGFWMIDWPEKTADHREQIPDEVIRRIIKMYTFEGEAVLDLQLGNSNTIEIARKLGRQAYGYEHEEQYMEIIKNKLGIGLAKADPVSMAQYAERSVKDESVGAELFGRYPIKGDVLEKPVEEETVEELVPA